MYSSTPLSECSSECHYMEIKGGCAGRCQTKFNFLTISFCENPKTETDQSVKPSHPDLEGRDSEKHGGDNNQHVWHKSCQVTGRHHRRGSSSQTGNEQQSLETSLSCISLATVTGCVHFFLFNCPSNTAKVRIIILIVKEMVPKHPPSESVSAKHENNNLHTRQVRLMSATHHGSVIIRALCGRHGDVERILLRPFIWLLELI